MILFKAKIGEQLFFYNSIRTLLSKPYSFNRHRWNSIVIVFRPEEELPSNIYEQPLQCYYQNQFLPVTLNAGPQFQLLVCEWHYYIIFGFVRKPPVHSWISLLFLIVKFIVIGSLKLFERKMTQVFNNSRVLLVIAGTCIGFLFYATIYSLKTQEAPNASEEDASIDKQS